MEKLQFKVKNIKCDGCVKSIKNELGKYTNINEVIIDKEEGKVSINGKDLDKSTIIKDLEKIGFPENKTFLSQLFS